MAYYEVDCDYDPPPLFVRSYSSSSLRSITYTQPGAACHPRALLLPVFFVDTDVDTISHKKKQQPNNERYNNKIISFVLVAVFVLI